MRKDEAATAEIVRQYLEAKLPGEAVRIVPETADPPDCWLHVGDAKFPCEITSFTDGSHGCSQLRPNVLAEDAYFAKLAHRLQAKLTGRNALSGSYVLLPFDRNLDRAVKMWWRRRTSTLPLQCKPSDLESLISEDLQASQSVAAGPVCTYESREGFVVSLEKLATTGCQLESTRVSGVKWEGEITNELGAELAYAMSEKSRKLRAKGLVPGSSVLVVVDRYAYASPAVLERVSERMPEIRQFHAVFYVLGNRKGDWHERRDYRHFCNALWAKDTRWIGSPFERKPEPSIASPTMEEHA